MYYSRKQADAWRCGKISENAVCGVDVRGDRFMYLLGKQRNWKRITELMRNVHILFRNRGMGGGVVLFRNRGMVMRCEV